MKTIVDLIEAKQAGYELTPEEIKQIVLGYHREEVPDYQMAAFLMAVFFRGMVPAETSVLLETMVETGERLRWEGLPGPVVDKHSTGGVGDKISLMLAPLLVADGCYVPMISGRGLGHTGGTLDKLDAIPGFQTRLSLEEIKQLLPKIGCVLAGQTAELAPVDRKMYSLRDVTATVRAVPLITASILCKKLSEGLDGLVIDLKVGRGAFADSMDFALALADSLYRNASRANIATRVL
ncbi:MAG: thymidine phosphorylase, partial [bacterium]|nr:thymidine phosphorylase [bacterium]